MSAPDDLFPGAPRRELEARQRQAPAQPLVPETGWLVVDHVCAKCFARLVGREADGKTTFRCTGCGWAVPTFAEPVMRTGGRRHPSICACSIRHGGRDAGIRCVRNDTPSPTSPAEIVARQVL